MIAINYRKDFIKRAEADPAMQKRRKEVGGESDSKLNDQR
jgi:hypothetical protein